MNISKKIKMVSVDKGMPIQELAHRVGMRPTSFSVKLSRGITKIDDAEKILNELDCDLAVIDRKTKKVY